MTLVEFGNLDFWGVWEVATHDFGHISMYIIQYMVHI